ncbi:MAG TPA: dihydrofolate reductase family protein [Humibacter sp.]|nr:dihydrofolate reductase family protein [Humibacter sp.]
MTDVVITLFMSLDGYIAGPGGEFIGPQWSAQMQSAWSDVNTPESAVFVYGRTNFEFNSGFWQGLEADESAPEAQRSFARHMHEIPKLVVSRTLTEADWNARVISDIPGEIAALKESTEDRNIIVIGGAGVAQSFLALGIVDRLRIMVTPLLLGGGIRLFEGDYERMSLERIDCIPIDTGSTILEYRVVRAHPLVE